MNGPWKIQAQDDRFSGRLEILIRKGDSVVGPLKLHKVDPGQLITPTIVETKEDQDDNLAGFLRAALNCAWDMGLRPDGFNDTREGMAAKDAHLQDMRAIAFHKIGADKPDGAPKPKSRP